MSASIIRNFWPCWIFSLSGVLSALVGHNTLYSRWVELSWVELCLSLVLHDGCLTTRLCSWWSGLPIWEQDLHLGPITHNRSGRIRNARKKKPVFSTSTPLLAITRFYLYVPISWNQFNVPYICHIWNVWTDISHAAAQLAWSWATTQISCICPYPIQPILYPSKLNCAIWSSNWAYLSMEILFFDNPNWEIFCAAMLFFGFICQGSGWPMTWL